MIIRYGYIEFLEIMAETGMRFMKAFLFSLYEFLLAG